MTQEAEAIFHGGMDQASAELPTASLLNRDQYIAHTVSQRVHRLGVDQALHTDAVKGEHDLRGAFALNFALAAVIRGVLSMENDQLDECRERLIEADRLAADGDTWVGQVRGPAASLTAR